MLHYTSYGIGNTIVLIHGFCENSTCFNRQVFLLKDKYRIITIDLPGHGLSPVGKDFSIADIAVQVKAILDAEKIETCTMIGHSMGGYVTLAFAQQFPERLNGLGLLHSTAVADTEERKQKRNQAIELIAKTGALTYVRNFIPPLFAPTTLNKIISERVESNADLTDVTLIHCLNALRDRPSSLEWISLASLPIAYFIGKHDALILETDLFEQASLIAVSKVIYLQQSAHMGMIEEADKVTEGIVEFVALCNTINA